MSISQTNSNLSKMIIKISIINVKKKHTPFKIYPKSIGARSSIQRRGMGLNYLKIFTITLIRKEIFKIKYQCLVQNKHVAKYLKLFAKVNSIVHIYIFLLQIYQNYYPFFLKIKFFSKSIKKYKIKIYQKQHFKTFLRKKSILFL